MDYPPPARPVKRDNTLLIVIGAVLAVVVGIPLLCFMCFGAVVLLDQTNSYCSLLGADQFFYCP
jgi:hypothetical protein